MPNEIYHRSEWGNPKAEGFGDVYFDASATNKLYKHSDNYENSDGTDKILRNIPNKASIVLTPTAYSDGSLNTVIPPYQVLSELVTNGNFDTDSDWIKDTGWSIQNGYAQSTALNTRSIYQYIGNAVVGRIYKVTYTILETNGGNFKVVYGGVNGTVRNSEGTYVEYLKATSSLDGNLYFDALNVFIGKIDNVSVKEIQEADFDFSRGSSATRVNEKGLIEDVQILSSNLVQNGDFEEIGSEEVINGNFENGGANWTNIGNNAVFENSTAIFENNAKIYQGVVSDLSKFYKISIDVNSVANDGLLITAGNGNSFISYSVDDIINNGNKIVLYSKFVDTGLLFVYSQSVNTSAVIDNVSVKEVGQNWTFQSGWSISDGVANYDFTSDAKYIRQTLLNGGFVSGKTYRIDFEITSGTAYMYINSNAAGLISLNTYSVGNYSLYTTASANGSDLLIYGRNTSGTAFSIDNISVIEITDDTDIPRIDYTSGQGALLLEPQSTNLITYSEDFTSNSNYTTNAPSGIFESGYLAPDGTLTATRINGFDGYYVALSSTGSDDARSMFVKSGNGQSGSVNLLDPNSNSNSLFEVTSEWKRVELVGVDSWFYIADGRGASLTLDDIIVWGLQQEDLSYATSYIKTEGSTVTRAADVANNSGNADLINSTEGVLYAEIAALASVSTNKDISISDGSTSNRIIIRVSSSTLLVYVISSGVTSMFKSTVINEITSLNKFAVKYKQNDFALWVNGVEIATDTSGNTPTGLDTLNFDGGTGADDFYGKVKSLAVFKEALTDEELQALTT